VGAAAIFDLVVVCPLLGIVVERVVYRPLQRRSASPAELLVASLGVLVVLLGVAVLVWGNQAHLDAPSLVPYRRLHLGGRLPMPLSTAVDLIVVAIVAAGLALGQRTALGLRVRAVVERRDLAQVRGIDANDIAALGWAIGASLAGLAGMLMAPTL